MAIRSFAFAISTIMYTVSPLELANNRYHQWSQDTFAIIYSLVETAKANNLKPFNYVQHLLEEIPKHMNSGIVLFYNIFFLSQKNFQQKSTKYKY